MTTSVFCQCWEIVKSKTLPRGVGCWLPDIPGSVRMCWTGLHAFVVPKWVTCVMNLEVRASASKSPGPPQTLCEGKKQEGDPGGLAECSFSF